MANRIATRAERKSRFQEHRTITAKDSGHEKRILCVIPSLPKDLNSLSIMSIINQTYPVEMLIVLPKEVARGTTSQKVSRVLNDGLSHVKLQDFDYLLRVDGDVVLPSNFLEENLRGEPDLCGGAGYAMLIKVKSFLKVMKGKFHSLSDDSYTCYKFMKEGFEPVKRRVEPVRMRQKGLHHGTSYFAKPRHQSILYFYHRGKGMHRLGYEPFHMFGRLRHSIWNIFAVLGYFAAIVRREDRLDVADFVWRRQVRRLLGLF